MITNVTVSQLFKKIEFKRAYTSCFLSSAGSEFQSLAPAIWKVFLPEEVLDCGTRECLGSTDFCFGTQPYWLGNPLVA